MSAPRKGRGQGKITLRDNHNWMARAEIHRAQPTGLASQRRDMHVAQGQGASAA